MTCSRSVDPLWDQRLARVAMRPLVSSRATPNQITTLSLALGLLGALLYAQGNWAMHLGAAGFVPSFWLDHADGELARMTGRSSPFGHYHDVAAGGCVLVAVLVGIGIGTSDAHSGAGRPRWEPLPAWPRR